MRSFPGRPGDAYVVLSHRAGDPDIDSSEWVLALVSAAAGRRDALQRHVAALMENAARLAASDRPWAEQWNAAQYAVRASLLVRDDHETLARAVRAAAAASRDQTTESLRLFQAAEALDRGALSEAEGLIAEQRQELLLARVLTIELRFRRGQAVQAAELLRSLEADLKRLRSGKALDWSLLELELLVARLTRILSVAGVTVGEPRR
jgi:hypothetical protein